MLVRKYDLAGGACGFQAFSGFFCLVAVRIL
jgi:hypothetical protein